MGDGKETLVTVLLRDADDGTEIEFIHSEFASEKARDMHQHGWESAFHKFDKLAW